MTNQVIEIPLDDKILEKVNVWAKERGLTEIEALRIMIGEAVSQVYVSHAVPIPVFPTQNKDDQLIKLLAAIYASTAKCLTCMHGISGEELLENEGHCFKCKPKPMDDQR